MVLAVNFIECLARQDSSIMISTVLESIDIDMLILPMQRTLNDKNIKDKKFYKSLSVSLKKLLDNQSFLEKVYPEEAEMYLNTLDESFFKRDLVGTLGVVKGTLANMLGMKEHLEAMRANLKLKTDEFAKYAQEAVQKNKPEIWDERQTKFKEEIQTKYGSWDKKRVERDDVAMASVFAAQLPLVKDMISKFYFIYDRIKLLYLSTSIKAFEIDNEQLPSQLSELIPSYIDNLPKDDFSDGNDFIYNKSNSGYLLYGLGPNRKDDQGKICLTEDDNDKNNWNGDICFAMGQ